MPPPERARSARQKRSNMRVARVGGEAFSRVLDPHEHLFAALLECTAIDPSSGVCRSAFVSRL